MNIMQLHLLGVPQVERAGMIYPIPRVKPLALLAYLAIEGGLHPRERLAALFWPDMDEQSGRANLRTTLASLRRALGARDGELGVWRAASDALGVEPADVLADTQKVATAAALARQRESPPGLSSQLEGAIAVYRGPLLDGVGLDISPDYDTWLLTQRELYHQHMSTILQRLAALREAAGDLTGVAETFERLVRHDPLDEVPYRRLLTTYLALGDTRAGRRAYETYRAMHTAEWGGEPDLEILALGERLNGTPTRLMSAPLSRGLPLDVTITPPMVGRAGEMVALRGRYAQACAGTVEVVVLDGATGMGKTRLATEFVRWAAAQGADVLEGRMFAPSAALPPYGALTEALRPRMERENSPDDLLGDRWLAELAYLLPELAERYPDLPPVAIGHPESPVHLSEAVVLLIDAWGKRSPIVLFLDDMQWADEATRALLLYAARRWAARGSRVLVLLSVQTNNQAVVPGLAAWLARLECEAATLRLHLRALGEAAAIELVSVLADAAPVRVEDAEARLGAWLHSASGGTPFLMVALLHGLLDAGLLEYRPAVAGGWALDLSGLGSTWDWHPGALPPRLRDVIATYVECVSPLAQDLLLIGAVWGAEFTLEQICALTNIPDEAVADALDRLAQAHLLCEIDGAGRYSFPHEILRTLVMAQAGGARRRMLYQRAQVLMEANNAPVVASVYRAPAAVVPEPGGAPVLTGGNWTTLLSPAAGQAVGVSGATRKVCLMGDKT